MQDKNLLTERIEQQLRGRVVHEFVTNSAVFPVLDGIRSIASDGAIAYISNLPHYIMFGAAGLQAWYLARQPHDAWGRRAAGNLLAPALYSAVDMLLEGPVNFAEEANHWVYWIFALGMAALTLLEGFMEKRPFFPIVARNIWRILLFPILYAISELTTELNIALTPASIYAYWFQNSSHFFILMAALLFGVLLGIQEAEVRRHTSFLQAIAHKLKRVSEWSLDSQLLVDSLDGGAALNQTRAERAVLFMDIRGFTQWSESKEPELVVGMLNQFYELAEEVIIAGKGSKPHFIGDEVMTWFEEPLQAAVTGCRLAKKVNAYLRGYGLASGGGIHSGVLIEGLMGSSATRSYNIIGDTVNTASRLTSAAQPGQILISQHTVRALPAGMFKLGEILRIQAKGKADPLLAHAIAQTEKQEQ